MKPAFIGFFSTQTANLRVFEIHRNSCLLRSFSVSIAVGILLLPTKKLILSQSSDLQRFRSSPAKAIHLAALIVFLSFLILFVLKLFMLFTKLSTMKACFPTPKTSHFRYLLVLSWSDWLGEVELDVGGSVGNTKIFKRRLVWWSVQEIETTCYNCIY